MNNIAFKNLYVTLGDAFYVKTCPTPVAMPSLIKFNDKLARKIGLPDFNPDSSEAIDLFSGNLIPDGAKPLAMAYAGHQFGHFNQQLGDGRAIFLGEVVNPDGVNFDMQLKGCGRTHYSRNGDGRSALGPVLREYLVSEAMVKLGVPTTRALALVTTGENVEREQLLPGGIITRIASSFVRVGTFQYFAAKGDIESIQKLADYVIDRNYPHVRDEHNPYAALLQAVIDAQAALIAQWMHLGFIHGVMNTDNMSIAGETIDYGPCAFMDDYNHNRVFSSIDRNGRYAYNNQPSIGLWNLTRLAESIIPLLAQDTDDAVDKAKVILNTYTKTYQHKWLKGMRAKLGLTAGTHSSTNDDTSLAEQLLDTMALNNADFTLTFFHLSGLDSQSTANDENIRNEFNSPSDFDNWATKWRDRLQAETNNDATRQMNMRKMNPVYIPRNHQIEAAIRAAEDHDDFSVFHKLHEVLQDPYTQQAGRDQFNLAPEPDKVIKHTFCGT